MSDIADEYGHVTPDALVKGFAEIFGLMEEQSSRTATPHVSMICWPSTSFWRIATNEPAWPCCGRE